MSETPDILLDIASDRAGRVRRDGAAQGLNLPALREAPLIDFRAPQGPAAVRTGDTRHPDGSGSTGRPGDTRRPGILIAEVKRRSPSKGDIAAIPEPAVLAGRYMDAGFARVSVLTEEARFGGSLADLVAVKKAHPGLAVLRKDFLLSLEDVEVSWCAGADAILLIATLLDAPLLEAMYRRCMELGMSALVEVHSFSDVEKIRPLAPQLVGINSRDLRRFRMEPLLPLETRSSIDWPCDVIYESGITCEDDALFVRGTGFSGFLVGEAVARTPELAFNLVKAWNKVEEARRRYGAWERLYARHREGVPLVKICGITNRPDALAAVDAGADILGFVLAESPRKTTPQLIRECADLKVLKAAVVVLGADEQVPDHLAGLLEEGVLDFLQFHGDEKPETVRAWPSYKAISLRVPEDAVAMETAGSPAVLVDAFSPDARGGTGIPLDTELVCAATKRRRLWIAGGLNSDNVGAIVREWKPGLVDVSGGVEVSKGQKDHMALRRFVTEAKGRDRRTPEVNNDRGKKE